MRVVAGTKPPYEVAKYFLQGPYNAKSTTFVKNRVPVACPQAKDQSADLVASSDVSKRECVLKVWPYKVGKLRDLKLPDRLVIEAKEESSVVPYLDLTSLRYPSEAIQSMRIPLIERFGVAEGVKCIARMFVNLESTCDNDTYASSVPDRFFCNLDISLKQALQNPLLVSERTPLCWRGSKPLEDTRSALKPSYCRLVLHYLEWLSAIDDLMAFDELQRIRVTTTHMIPAILLTMTFNSFKHDSSRILLCNGFYYSANKCEREEYGSVDLIMEIAKVGLLSTKSIFLCH
ncbi:hypothetical protein ANCCEY_04659 [Ancylostoma ceylanicum]|uniref:Uncharacterized protein n=1 Tax=Ancylostoma ceylanicum TaxID=53326 RepID=A0A0D6M8N1_9BILA|nr:hypothetical protein ANCCEY_04659 [Ancylostoma ceylanicum]